MLAATFTNIHGHSNNGIVLTDNRSESGMLEVLWDEFPELEQLIKNRNRRDLSEADVRSVVPRISWVSEKHNPYVAGHTPVTIEPLNGHKFHSALLKRAANGEIDEVVASFRGTDQ